MNLTKMGGFLPHDPGVKGCAGRLMNLEEIAKSGGGRLTNDLLPFSRNKLMGPRLPIAFVGRSGNESSPFDSALPPLREVIIEPFCEIPAVEVKSPGELRWSLSILPLLWAGRLPHNYVQKAVGPFLCLGAHFLNRTKDEGTTKDAHASVPSPDTQTR